MIFPPLIGASDTPASYFLSAAAQTPIIASEVATETNTVVRLRRLNPVIHELQFALTSFAGMRCLGQRQPDSFALPVRGRLNTNPRLWVYAQKHQQAQRSRQHKNAGYRARITCISHHAGCNELCAPAKYCETDRVGR